MTINLTTLTEQTVWQTVRFVHPTYGALDPTGYPVEMALAPFGEAPTSFFAAAWEADSTAAGQYLAYAEFGDASTTGALTDGLFSIWLRITLPDQNPVLKGDTVFVSLI
jgi:hypothetical protein